MKRFIYKICRGSKLALFLEILLLIQIIFFTRVYLTRPECPQDDYYPGNISMGDNYYDD